MKIPVSWSTYWIIIIILCCVYYLVVLLLYYRKELASFRKRPLLYPPEPPGMPSSPAAVPPSPTPTGQPDLHSAVHDFTDALNKQLQELAASAADKTKTISVVMQLLRAYPSLKGSPFQEALTNLIVAQCAERCSIVLDARDTHLLWP